MDSSHSLPTQLHGCFETGGRGEGMSVQAFVQCYLVITPRTSDAVKMEQVR